MSISPAIFVKNFTMFEISSAGGLTNPSFLAKIAYRMPIFDLSFEFMN